MLHSNGIHTIPAKTFSDLQALQVRLMLGRGKLSASKSYLFLENPKINILYIRLDIKGKCQRTDFKWNSMWKLE